MTKVTHMRRIMVNRSECDTDDEREFADDPSTATCAACREAYARRAADWHRELREGMTPRPEPVDDEPEEETRPGKGQRRGPKATV